MNVLLNTSYMCTGEILKMLRLVKGIPQKTLAKCLGTSQPAVSKIEHSKKISDETFEKHRKAVNCSKEELEKFKKLLHPRID